MNEIKTILAKYFFKIKEKIKRTNYNSKTFFISDLHIGHLNILKMDGRPFKTLDEMNETIIKNWNNTVKKSDEVYILGDFFFKGKLKDALTFIEQLNGNLHLIIGNHENLILNNKILQDKFKSILHYKELNLIIDNKKFDVILSHYPIINYNGNYKDNRIMLYGHVHNTKEEDIVTISHQLTLKNYKKIINLPNVNGRLMLNVGCMMPWMNFTPQPLEYLIEVAKLNRDYLERSEILDVEL